MESGFLILVKRKNKLYIFQFLLKTPFITRKGEGLECLLHPINEEGISVDFQHCDYQSCITTKNNIKLGSFY